MEVYLIRHTTPQIEKGICYGQSDISLASSFESEWENIRRELPQSIDCIYTSPLMRCRQLAQKLEQYYGVPLYTDTRLMEMHFGEWEMKAWNSIDKHALEKWMNNYVLEKSPSGESYSNLLARVKDFISILKEQSFNKVLAVTHGGVIKSFYSITYGITPEEAMSKQISYGKLCRFVI